MPSLLTRMSMPSNYRTVRSTATITASAPALYAQCLRLIHRFVDSRPLASPPQKQQAVPSFHLGISLTVAFNSVIVRSYLLLAPGAFISGLGLIELTTRSNCLGLSSSRIYSLAVSTSPASANVMAIKMFSIFFDNPFIPDPPLP